jgi:perosamine synthetase
MLTLLRKLEADEELAFLDRPGRAKDQAFESRQGVRFSTGRAALTALIRRLGLTSADAVMMPAYIAEGVIKPFRAAGIQVVFYGLTSSLMPDLGDVELLIRTHTNTRLMILWHPYGFEAPAAEIMVLVGGRGIKLLEDCAHAAFSRTEAGDPMGTTGHFALFSFNKFLPVPDGALLTGMGVDDVDCGVTGDEIDTTTIDHYLGHLRLSGELLRCGDPEAARTLLELSGNEYDQYYEVINNDFSPKRQSTLSRTIERGISSSELIDRRRRNALALYSHLANPKLRLVFPKLTGGVVPFAVPVVTEASSRDRLIEHAWSRGVHLATLIQNWCFLPEGDAGRFVNERAFIDSHVLVPVNEFLTGEDIAWIAEVLNTFD